MRQNRNISTDLKGSIVRLSLGLKSIVKLLLKGPSHLLRTCQMYPNDMSEDATRPAGHVGNCFLIIFGSLEDIESFKMFQDCDRDVNSIFFIGRKKCCRCP